MKIRPDQTRPNQWIADLVTGFPKTTLAVFLILSLGAALFIPGLKKDPTPYLLPKTHESRVNLEKLRQEFTGSNDGILVLLEADKTIFNPDTLLRIQRLTKAFENLNLITDMDKEKLLALGTKAGPELRSKIQNLVKASPDFDTWMLMDEIRESLDPKNDSTALLAKALEDWTEKLSPVKKMTSLSGTDNIMARDGKLDVSPVFNKVPQTPEALARLEQEVRSNALFEDILVAGAGSITSIILELNLKDDDTDGRFLLYQKVRDILEKQIPGREAHYIAGLPVVTGALGKVMQSDTQRLFPIVIGIVAFFLLFTFRQVTGVIVPLSVVVLSLLITLGLKAMFHIPLNIITTTLPVFILSIGVADGIHIFSEYRDNRLKGLLRAEAIREMLGRLTLPVIMTSVTTAVAFFAISITKIVQLRHFGIFVGIGTMAAMVFSLFFIPSLLMVMPERKKISPKKKPVLKTAYASVLVRWTRAVVRHPGITASAALAILVISLFGAFQVVVDNDNTNYFLKDSDIFVSTQKLDTDAAGSSVINLMQTSSSSETEPFKKPENLLFAEELSGFLETRPDVGKLLGLTRLIRRVRPR